MKGMTFVGRSAVAGAIGTLALAVSGIGIAAAANGGSLTLGQSNKATDTTTLKDTSSTPLSLVAGKHDPALKVSNDHLIKHLNAEKLGGLTPGAISSGSTSQLKFSLNQVSGDVLLPASTLTDLLPVSIFKTAKLSAGTYAVNAGVFGIDAVCWVDTNSTSRVEVFSQTNETGDSEGSDPLGNAALSATLTVKAGQQITTYCAGVGTPDEPTPATTPRVDVPEVGGIVIDGGMTAIKILSDKKGTAVAPPPPTPLIKRQLRHALRR
jgi:hypothetical protein